MTFIHDIRFRCVALVGAGMGLGEHMRLHETGWSILWAVIAIVISCSIWEDYKNR